MNKQAPFARLSPVVCAYGTHGVRTVSGREPAAQFVLLIDVEALAVVDGMTLARIEYRDVSGTTIVQGLGSAEARVIPVGRSTSDLSTAGTAAFGGHIEREARVRLGIYGTLDGTVEAIVARSPVTFQAELMVRDGRRIMVAGSVDPPWPSG